MLATYSDEQLIALLRNDDRHAFAELYNRYWKKLLVQAVCKVKSEMEAEEIVQTVFLNIWKKRHDLTIRYSFYTYIAACVKHEIMASMARSYRKQTFIRESLQHTIEKDNSTIELLDFESTRKQLEEAVQSLPEKCRLVFRLSREKGMSEKQIAESLDISVKTVEAHKTKALKILRATLQQLLPFLFIILHCCLIVL